MLSSLDDLLSTKKQDNDDRKIDDQRMLQSNRMKLNWPTQTKEVVSDPTFPCLINKYMQKIKYTERC